MKFSLPLLLIVLLIASCSRVSQIDDTELVKGQLAALERRLIAAVQKKDMAALNEIWDDQYFGTAPNGRTVNKKDLMAAVKDGVIVIDSIEPDDLYVRLFGDVAVMTGRAAVKATVVDQEIKTEVRGTGIFVRRSDGWKIAGVHVGPYRPDESIDPEMKK